MNPVNLPAARRIARETGLAVREARVVGSQHGYQHVIIALAGGKRAFAKVAAALLAPGGTTPPIPPAEAVPAEMGAAFAAEASGLRWLAEADAVPVPEVLAVTETALVISMIPPGHPTPSAAFGFGAELARMHAAGAADFGAPWRGFIASLPLDNTPLDSSPADWPRWYASRRPLPYLRLAVDAGALGPDDARLIETVTERIAGVCLLDVRVDWARVTVHKPGAPIEATFADVTLTITRSNPQQTPGSEVRP